jgi:hypothetical protein
MKVYRTDKDTFYIGTDTESVTLTYEQAVYVKTALSQVIKAKDKAAMELILPFAPTMNYKGHWEGRKAKLFNDEARSLKVCYNEVCGM